MVKRVRIQWRERPKHEPWYVEGKTTEKGTIVLYKDRATKLSEEHEKAHIELGHLRKARISPRELVAHEIEAELYTYRKMGRPLSIRRPMRGVIKELKEYWGIERREAIEIIRDVTKRFGNRIPKIWVRGLNSI